MIVQVNKRRVREFLATYAIAGQETLDAFIGRSELTEAERNYAWWYACAAANQVANGFIGITINFDGLVLSEKQKAMAHVFEEIDENPDKRHGFMEAVVGYEFDKQSQKFEVVSSVVSRQISRQSVVIMAGTFIRVRADHENQARAGKDGMVFEDVKEGDDQIALVFHFDRHNQGQNCECVGPELWEKSELDMTTMD